MNKHTPGPWFAVADKGQTIIRTGRTSAAFSPIAVVKGDKRDTLKDQEANAVLMAAAPDLLEALENMLAAFDNQILRRKLASDFNAQAILESHAAISRARGQS